MLSIVVWISLAVIFCEAALLLFEQRRYALQLLLATVTAGIDLALWFWIETPWTLFPESKTTASLLGLWMVTVLVVVLSGLSFGASRLKSPVLKHLVILLICPIVMYAYPWFVLMSVCASGLDCI
jgi:hypothetical protein